MNLDALVVLCILIIGFPKWIMAVQCGRRRYHDQFSDNPFTAAVKKSDDVTWTECLAMLLLPHGRVFESDLLVTSSECIDAPRFNITDGYVAAFDRGYDEFAIRTPIHLEAHGLRLLQLNNTVTFTNSIQPICVPSGPSPIPHNGTTLRWTHGMNGLLEIEAVLVADEECGSSTEYNPLLMFCIKANYIHRYVPPGNPYFTEVNGVNILWGLYAFRAQYGRERRHAFHRMAPFPEYVSFQMPGEQGYQRYGQYAPLRNDQI